MIPLFQKTILCIFLFCLILISTPPGWMMGVSAQTDGVQYGQNSSIFSFDGRVKADPSTIYQIKLISPNLLQTIIQNQDPDDVILKVKPGEPIGIATPQILYIRGDLQSDTYLLRNRNTVDMKNIIIDHLLDISFGRDNANLRTLEKDRKYMIWFDSGYTSEDIEHSLQFARMFNNLSATTQFEDEEVMKGELKNNYETVPYYYYDIKIIPKQSLENYQDDKYDSSREEILNDENDNLVGILSNDSVLLWDGLEKDTRQYYITKALLWHLGLHGESTRYPDSFFSPEANISKALSDMDKSALELLYGGRLKANMTADEVRKTLLIQNN
jgi:hypothetical protein